MPAISEPRPFQTLLGDAAAAGAGAPGVEVATACLKKFKEFGSSKSTEQPEPAPIKAITKDAANAITAARRAPGRGNNVRLCISLIDDRPDFRGLPIVQLFTARQRLQDGVELREQLRVIAGLTGFDSRDHLV